jgi:hypothetical protein
MTRGRPDNTDTPLDTEADATATAIAGVRARLRRGGILDHPIVQQELRKLEAEITSQLAAQADRRSGRHRTLSTRRSRSQIEDADGYDLKPNPLMATTPEEFIRILWRYKIWSGDPSWRKMAANAGQAVVHSTMHAAMNGDALPKLDVVKAIVTGCGGSEDDLRAFATAWRHIESDRISSSASGGGLLPAPVPSLRLVPSG